MTIRSSDSRMLIGLYGIASVLRAFLKISGPLGGFAS